MAFIKEGFTMIDLRNGDKYIVESNDGTRIIASSEDGEKEIRLLDATELEMYLVVGEKTAIEIEEGDYTLEDGELTVFDRKVETGTLRIEEVLTHFPGKLVLKVKSKDSKQHELFTYDFENDRFDKVTHGYSEITLLDSDEKGFYMLSFLTTAEVKDENDAVVAVDVLDNKVKAFYKDYCLMSEQIGDFAILPEDKVSVSDCGNDRIITVESCGRFKAIKSPVNEDEEITVVEKVKKTSVSQYRITGFEPEEGEDVYLSIRKLSCTVESTDIKDVTYSKDGDFSLIVICDDGIYVTNGAGQHMNARGQKAAEIAAEYPNVVKCEKVANKVIMTLFADGDDPKGGKLFDTLKGDRGYVVEFTEFCKDSELPF